MLSAIAVYFVAVLVDKVFPRAETVFHFGFAHLDEMAVGGSKGIGSVALDVHVAGIDFQHSLEHPCHLLLGGRTVAGDGNLNLFGLVFGDGNVAHDGCGDGYALRTSELEHRLHILAVEGCFDSHFVGFVGVDDAGDALEDFSQPEVVALIFLEFDDTHGDELSFVAYGAQHSIAHDLGARVNAQNDFLYVGSGFCHVSSAEKREVIL